VANNPGMASARTFFDKRSVSGVFQRQKNILFEKKMSIFEENFVEL